ncbi:unnamed protein product [Pieris macdunnoughi]|uniref:Uncharacterized protein n=1 Tax=Pieris macdunnoughi TaxID=345717 RepID=A0A821SD57_9NEOP|nr:unnamed protein product [Pieris macdunnoughi]
MKYVDMKTMPRGQSTWSCECPCARAASGRRSQPVGPHASPLSAPPRTSTPQRSLIKRDTTQIPSQQSTRLLGHRGFSIFGLAFHSGPYRGELGPILVGRAEECTLATGERIAQYGRFNSITRTRGA